jgi:hypothetical protein
MFESIYKALESFVNEFSLRKLVGALFLLVVGTAAFTILDRYSPYFTMGRLERATGLLERLTKLQPSPAEQELLNLKEGIVRQLRNQVEPTPLIAMIAEGPTVTVFAWKFFSGASVWILFALFYLPYVKQDSSNWSGVWGAVFLGIIFGLLGTAVIPDDWATWRTLAAYGIGNFAISILVLLLWQNRRTLKPALPPA